MNNGNLGLSAWLLLQFCREPGTPDYAMSGIHYELGTELGRLDEVFPNFRDELVGTTVIDFGCGKGYQSIACAVAGAREVIGVDTIEDDLRFRRELASNLPYLAGRVQFVDKIPSGMKADVIISQNAFEHFLEPAQALAEIREALAPAGKLFLTFAPPWYAPWGAHMAFFCRFPWVQLLFSERTVMRVRSLFRSDGARTYREAGLGQMSLCRFERVIKASGLVCSYSRYDCIRGLSFLGKTPLRELFVNRVSCILVLPPAS